MFAVLTTFCPIFNNYSILGEFFKLVVYFLSFPLVLPMIMAGLPDIIKNIVFVRRVS